MSDVHVPFEGEAGGLSETAGLPGSAEALEAPRPIAAPIGSRFLFVDVSAQRAKQLRRGATPRVVMPETHKLERVAMREVSGGFVEWTLPAFKGVSASARAGAKAEVS